VSTPIDRQDTNLSPRTIAAGTVIWTAPSGHTYVTTPGSALLFPALAVSTGDLPDGAGGPGGPSHTTCGYMAHR
jgi:hypothetical protein